MTSLIFVCTSPMVEPDTNAEEKPSPVCGVCSNPIDEDEYIAGKRRGGCASWRGTTAAKPAPPPRLALPRDFACAATCSGCGPCCFHVDCVTPILLKIHHDSTRAMERARVGCKAAVWLACAGVPPPSAMRCLPCRPSPVACRSASSTPSLPTTWLRSTCDAAHPNVEVGRLQPASPLSGHTVSCRATPGPLLGLKTHTQTGSPSERRSAALLPRISCRQDCRCRHDQAGQARSLAAARAAAANQAEADAGGCCGSAAAGRQEAGRSGSPRATLQKAAAAAAACGGCRHAGGGGAARLCRGLCQRRPLPRQRRQGCLGRRQAQVPPRPEALRIAGEPALPERGTAAWGAEALCATFNWRAPRMLAVSPAALVPAACLPACSCALITRTMASVTYTSALAATERCAPGVPVPVPQLSGPPQRLLPRRLMRGAPLPACSHGALVVVHPFAGGSAAAGAGVGSSAGSQEAVGLCRLAQPPPRASHARPSLPVPCHGPALCPHPVRRLLHPWPAERSGRRSCSVTSGTRRSARSRRNGWSRCGAAGAPRPRLV